MERRCSVQQLSFMDVTRFDFLLCLSVVHNFRGRIWLQPDILVKVIVFFLGHLAQRTYQPIPPNYEFCNRTNQT